MIVHLFISRNTLWFPCLQLLHPRRLNFMVSHENVQTQSRVYGVVSIALVLL